jgi:hypothetical protein
MEKTDLDFVSSYVSKLSIRQIENLPDEKMLFLRMERPEHKGQYGFMLDQKYFESNKHFTETIVALMIRLGKVKK